MEAESLRILDMERPTSGGWTDDYGVAVRRAPAKGEGVHVAFRALRAAPLVAGGWGASATVERASAWSLPTLACRARLTAIVVAGAAGAAYVGYLTAQNPVASPAHFAVIFRVVIIMSLILAGVYAQTDPKQERMGRLLVAAGFYSCVWLLNGSRESLAFSVGVAAAGVGLPLFYYLLAAHPGGRLHGRMERLFILIFAIFLPAAWAFCTLTSTQPAIATPLLDCKPHCPTNALYIGSSSATETVGSVVLAAWVLLACGTFLLLVRRLRLASAPLRRSLTPTVLVAMASVLLLLGFFVNHGPGSDTRHTFGYLYVAMSAAVPIAILLGLALERQYMGQGLARFIAQLSRTSPSGLQTLMASALHDPSLTIAYPRAQPGGYVDHSGAPVLAPGSRTNRAVTEIEHDGHRVASVLYDTGLSDQEAFVRAAGAAAALRLEHAQLETELKASMVDLARSRRRLVEAADAERQRIERDLHDGAQQHLVGMRVKLALAMEAVQADRALGERMLGEIGTELDEALEELRSLAQGVYPALLAQRGLTDALRSAARQCSAPVSVCSRDIGRYAPDAEAAVYFCCREALQNVAKHAGEGAVATIGLWEKDSRLYFEVTDSGVGFARAAVAPGRGIVNMRDRIEAVGGMLAVSSGEEMGTLVAGSVPVQAASAGRQ